MSTASAAATNPPVPAAVPPSTLLQLLQNASRELRDLDVGRSVDRVSLRHLTPLQFATEYVQQNKPVIITGAIDDWPATQLWGERYLEEHSAGQAVVTVDVTPNGRGDAVTPVLDSTTGARSRWFVTPHERRTTLRDFFRLMRETREQERRAAGRVGRAAASPREVPYMQHQNSNLSEELGQLLADIQPGLPWAEQVFGGPPEATNIWIGDDRSATSFHKDHYENLYAVIRGTKIFTLLPPCDAYRMYLVRCPAASYMPLRDVPPGASYGEVSPQPGGLPAARRPPDAGAAPDVPPTAAGAAAGAAAAEVVASQAGPDAAALMEPGKEGHREERTSRQPRDGVCAAAAAAPGAVPSRRCRRQEEDEAAAEEEEEEEAGASGRLVAVLQDPGYEVLWSAVDMTVEDAEARREQPLFFGGARRPALDDPAAAACAGGSGGDRVNGSSRSNGSSSPSSSGRGGDTDSGIVVEDAYEDGDGGSDDGDSWDAAGGAPLVAEVGPGEVLYLPSLWYHQVEQSTRAQPAGRPQAAAAAAQEEEEYVIAVNFWYDMKYDSRYVSFKLLEGLATALGLAEEPPQRESGA